MPCIRPFPSAVTRAKRQPIRWSSTASDVTCRRCHHVWEEGDPAYGIACRGCAAPVGAPCRRIRGGNERVCHQRDGDAIRMGLLEPCDGLSWDGRHDKPLPLHPVPFLRACKVLTGSPANMEPPHRDREGIGGSPSVAA